MKRPFIFLLLCSALAFASCGDKTSPADGFSFAAPVVSELSSTGAKVSCTVTPGSAPLSSYDFGFAYGLASDSMDEYTTTDEVIIDGNTLICYLDDLIPETKYRVVALYREASQSVYSPQKDFTTARAGNTELRITSGNVLEAYPWDGGYVITYEVINPVQGASVTASSGSDAPWIHSFDCRDGQITFDIDQSGSTERSGVITVKYPGTTSRTVEVRQAASEPDDPTAPTFGDPYSANVTAASAQVNCTIGFPQAGNYTVYFRYRVLSSSNWQQSPVSASAGLKTATLTGLSSATQYQFVLCAELNGTTYTSLPASFTTLQQSGGAKYAGWPELPLENRTITDYYAYHICPDVNVPGTTQKRRNFTVCFSAEHHCPFWTAAPRHACYEVKNTTRTNSYDQDPQIPESIQYYNKDTGGGCNKGHMLGSAERLVSRQTNLQVFYYSNIAPQLSDSFNTGGGAWNNLEGFVDGQVCADTTYVVIGAYFKEFTDAYGKSCSPAKIQFGGRSDVTRPSMFYYLVLRTKNGNTKKSVMNCTADELKCAAFVLRHNMEKGHTPQARDMMSVADLEALTGFTFFPNVPNAPKSTYRASDWGL